jgi:Regulator of chromosome condensation (RCC1) repeat
VSVCSTLVSTSKILKWHTECRIICWSSCSSTALHVSCRWKLCIIISALVLSSSEGAGTATGLGLGEQHTCVIRASDSSSLQISATNFNLPSFCDLLCVCDGCSVGSTPAEPAAEYTVDLGGRKVSDVNCGAYHTCVLQDRGTVGATVKCFGDNNDYQLVSKQFSYCHHSSLLGTCMCLPADVFMHALHIHLIFLTSSLFLYVRTCLHSFKTITHAGYRWQCNSRR